MNIKSVNADMTIYKSGYYSDTIILTGTNGKPIDITGYKFYLTVKTALSDVDGSAILQKSWTSHTSATEGTTSFEITMAESDAIAAGQYVYDIAFLDVSTPKKKYVVLTGNLIVTVPVTKSTT